LSKLIVTTEEYKRAELLSKKNKDKRIDRRLEVIRRKVMSRSKHPKKASEDEINSSKKLKLLQRKLNAKIWIIQIPCNIKPIFIPPYTPEMNPIE